MNRAQWGSVAVATLIAFGGCAPRSVAPLARLSDEAAGVGQRLIREADELPGGVLRPRQGPRVEIPRPVADDIESRIRARTAAALESQLGNIDDIDEARLVLRAACNAKDLVAVGQADSWEDAAVAALVNFGGDATRRARVSALARDLSTASGVDVVGALAVFIVCEST